MDISRRVFEEHKNNVWLIELKEDKYLHLPKLKTIIKGMFEFLKWIIFIPILLIVGMFYGIYQGIGQIVCDFGNAKSNFRNIFPNIVNVVEHFDLVEDVKVKDEYREENNGY